MFRRSIMVCRLVRTFSNNAQSQVDEMPLIRTGIKILSALNILSVGSTCVIAAFGLGCYNSMNKQLKDLEEQMKKSQLMHAQLVDVYAERNEKLSEVIHRAFEYIDSKS